MVGRSLGRASIVLGIAVALAACGGSATPPPASSAGAPSTPGASVGPPASSAAGGANGFEGSFKTSGLYSATWTVAKDAEPYPFNASTNPSVTSDKGTFGNIAVDPDGSVSFGSGATEFSGAYKGTGAKVTLDTTGQFVCAFTVDIDLTGTNDKAILHVTGGMKVHWSLGVGEQNCP